MSYHLLWWFLIFQSSQSAWLSPQLYFFFALGESSFCVLKILRNSRNWGLASRRGNLSIVQGQQKWCRATSWMLLMVPGQVMLRSAKIFLGYAKLILAYTKCMMQPNVMFFKCIYTAYFMYYIFLRHDRHGNSETATLDLGIGTGLIEEKPSPQSRRSQKTSRHLTTKKTKGSKSKSEACRITWRTLRFFKMANRYTVTDNGDKNDMGVS